MQDLAPGTLGILEPRDELRKCAERKVDVGEIDLLVVPGVAFDPGGGRLGHGKGYYDRLLRRAPRETPSVGLAFECQVFPEVPMMEHDVFLHKVITENTAYVNADWST
jgi:5-formyltetrahydrofolate cyclo-ligase